MGVNIGGGGEVAVPQPFLNLLHGNVVCQKKAGAAVAQIVEADILSRNFGTMPYDIIPVDNHRQTGIFKLVFANNL